MKDPSSVRHYAALAGAAVLWLLVLLVALWVVAVPAEAQVLAASLRELAATLR